MKHPERCSAIHKERANILFVESYLIPLGSFT
jgi:hypothetical protein